MAKHAMGLMNIWGVLHLGLVVCGLIATAGVGAQDPPSPKGSHKRIGNPEETKRYMRLCYEALKDNGWSNVGPALRYAHVPDQQLAEWPDMRNPQITSFCFPSGSVYNEVALYCDLYFRKNQGFEDGKGVSKPEGFYLVMFKDGHLAEIPGERVREIPCDAEPGATMPVFPGMDEYDPSLPKLCYYQAPWYRGDKDQDG